MQVHSLFSMLGVNHAYVTAIGRLKGKSSNALFTSHSWYSFTLLLLISHSFRIPVLFHIPYKFLQHAFYHYYAIYFTLFSWFCFTYFTSFHIPSTWLALEKVQEITSAM
jgi:hypothetical protein